MMIIIYMFTWMHGMCTGIIIIYFHELFNIHMCVFIIKPAKHFAT